MKLKICGVQNADEARLLAERGVDFIGLNFVPTSKRQIDVQVAKEIVASLEHADTTPVVLFQNEPIDSVLATLDALGVDNVQLHGDESAQYMEKLASSGYKTIKSVPINPETTLEEAEAYMHDHPADIYLLDRAQQGTGEMVNPDLATRLAREHTVILAGGLSSQNLERVLANLAPESIYGIDIAAGVRDDLTLNLDKLDKVIDILRIRQ